MKVLILNGSPRVGGNTSLAVKEIAAELERQGVESEIVQIGNKPIRGCIACNSCKQKGCCVFDDEVNKLAPKFEEADGLIAATPVYYASANATLIACLDRLFYSTSFDKTMKVGAAVTVARRGGCSATFDEINKYFAISNMPIVTSQYWNCIHGREKGDAAFDSEGMQTMRTLAKNMAFMIKSIALGKEKYGLPEKEPWEGTHFIRDDLRQGEK
ncbi:MAG: flavodoxin family protein [Ruminococcus sp.]|nr:flavodoxin family protein [Ruminococcus sp.]